MMPSLFRFVPECAQPTDGNIKEFVDVLKTIRHLVVMTGAGISTESGIPDYRSPKVGQYARTDHRPVLHGDFMQSLVVRKRFWTRNFVAWPRFSASQPNVTHQIIANWEKSKRFTWLITQNVDGLHTAAGSKMLSELHGCGRRVICMNCHSLYDRQIIQEWIQKANPNWCLEEIGELAPDGDCDIPDKAVDNFNPPVCPKCGPKSILKTDVVFFGGFIDPEIQSKCYDMVKSCDGLLVLGSSLTVLSSYRYVQQAFEQSTPILIANIGPTAADDLATVKISAKCSDIIKHVSNL
uniref:Deacetylase sirtuin-type domain-containing protein n=1 Tax=Onchocerca volvulus TaxID=6282 RepID=A0A8R1TMY2_ONCVO